MREFVFKKGCITSILSFCAFSSLVAAKNEPAPASPPPYDADLFSKDREVVFIDAELLYRTVLEDGLEYASQMKEPVATAEIGAMGDYRKPKFKWRPGFKITAGYFNAPKYWDVTAEYTWFESRGNSSIAKPGESNLYLLSTMPIKAKTTVDEDVDNIIASAKADIHYRYNLAEGLVTRNFFPNEHLRLRVLGGLSSTWQNQSMTARYNLEDNTKSKTAYHWGYWGVGFRIGMQTDWYWGKDFYFTGRASGALMVGRYLNTTKTLVQQTSDEEMDTVLADLHYADYRGGYNFQFVLGPSWQKSYEKHRFELFLGYEIDSWFNLAETRSYILASKSASSIGSPQEIVQSSPITMNGITLRFTLDF